MNVAVAVIVTLLYNIVLIQSVPLIQIAKVMARQQPTLAETVVQGMLSVIMMIVPATLQMQIMIQMTDVRLIY
jgi:hypothetical protein